MSHFMHALCDALPVPVVQWRAANVLLVVDRHFYICASWLSNLTQYSRTFITSHWNDLVDIVFDVVRLEGY